MKKDNETITKHFDFRLDGNINGRESGKQNDFAYAMFRDELKGRDNCNPDINIEQKWGKGDGVENQTNPHWTKTDQANEKYPWIKWWTGQSNFIFTRVE